MLDVGDVDAVALAELAGLEVEVELRHEEQRQALGARAGALGAGQHQVDDVLEQVVGVARGDEALDAVDVPGAVGLLDGLGAAGADVGAGVGLGEHHGGAPAALGGDARPTSSARRCRGCRRCWRSRRRTPYMHTAGLAPRMCSCSAHVQRARAPACRRVPRARPSWSQPPSMHGAHRLLERLGQRHRVRLRVEDRRVAVAVGERLGDRALGQPGDLAQHLAGGVGVQVGVRALAERLVDAEHLEQVEYLVTDVALVVAHVSSSMRMPLCGWVLRLSYPPVTAAQLYRPVTSTQSHHEQFPCS